MDQGHGKVVEVHLTILQTSIRYQALTPLTDQLVQHCRADLCSERRA